MEKLNFVGLDAGISNTGKLTVRAYVEGHYPNIHHIPTTSGQTEIIGYSYSLNSEYTGKQETGWIFHGEPQDAWKILQALGRDNLPSVEVQRILQQTKQTVSSSPVRLQPHLRLLRAA